MSNVSLVGSANWISGILSTIFIIVCFYFVLNFFQHLKNNDGRLANQSKILAVIFLALALLVPALFNIYLMYQMMR